MSTRTNLRPQLVITNGSMAANITSTPTILQSLTGVGYQATWTGTAPIGTLAIQISNNYQLDGDGRTVRVAGDWSPIYVTYNGSAVASVPITGNSGSAFIEGVSRAYAIRLVYTFTSGTGTMNATFNGKVS